MRDAPLSRLRILEIGHMLAGPYCGMLLSDLGAEVIKVEMPPDGDMARDVGLDKVDGHNVYFSSLNRGKKSVRIDLNTPAGRAEFEALVRDADGLITNLRPGAIRKLGLTFDALKGVNPRIACLALTGFGMEGTHAARPAYDYIIQAMMGLMNLTGDPGAPPTKTGYSVVDNSSGIMGALALVAMIQGGEGGQVDVSLYDTMISQMNYIAAGYLNSGKAPQRVASGGHPYLVPAQTFETADGHVSIFISHDRFWKAFAKGVGRDSWITDPVFATTHARSEHRQTVIAALSDLFCSGTTQHWVDILEPLGIVIAGVSTLEEALAGDIVRERGLVTEIPLDAGSIRLVGAPFKIDGYTPDYRPAPRLGEHDGTIGPRRKTGKDSGNA